MVVAPGRMINKNTALSLFNVIEAVIKFQLGTRIELLNILNFIIMVLELYIH